MKITVLGCGVLGQLWLAALSRRGHDVQGWLRVPQSVCTVHIVNPAGQENYLQLTANNIEHLATSDLLLVTLKAWQVSKAIRALLPQLSANCTILLLHNGLGTHDELPVLIQPLVMGITTHAAHRKGNKIHHVYSGITCIGPANSQAVQNYAIAKVLHHSLPEVTWHHDIFTLSWLKLAVNCVINPLTTIYNCRNGELKKYSTEVEIICREVAMVMNHDGYRTNYDSLLFHVNQISHNTTDNISSMLQDIRAQRRSEIDYITGYILQRARIHGLTVPKNQQLFNLVKRKEESYIYV